MRAGLDLRLLRAAVFAVACVALAAAGHVSAAAQAVPLWSLAAGWLLVFAFTLPLVGRERHSLAGITAALAGIQLGLHALFSLGQSTNGAAAHHGHGSPGNETLTLVSKLLCNDHGSLAGLTPGEAARIVTDAGLPLPPAGGETAVLGLTGPMLFGHLLAAVLAGWLLLHGEAALWQLVRLSSHHLAGFSFIQSLARALTLAGALGRRLPPLPQAPSARHSAAHPVPATVGTALHDTVIRRGPPPLRSTEALSLAA